MKSMCKKSFWVYLGESIIWVKMYVQEKILGEEFLGEKYMGEKSVQEEPAARLGEVFFLRTK